MCECKEYDRALKNLPRFKKNEFYSEKETNYLAGK
jgi:hypothetical protein